MSDPPGGVRRARLWRLVAGLAAVLLIGAALLLAALRLGLALVPGNAERARAWIEQETGFRVEYSRVDARLRAFGPEIVLRDAQILDRDSTQVMFAAKEAAVGLDLWNFFRTGELVAGRVVLQSPRITVVRLQDGRIRLLGQRDRPVHRPPFDLDRLPAGIVQILDATVDYRDLARGTDPLRLRDLDLGLERKRRHVRLEGSATLPQSLGGSLRFEGRLQGSLHHVEELVARIEAEADPLRLAGLAPHLPAAMARPTAGEGRVRAVLELDRGQLKLARLDLNLRDVGLDLPLRDVPGIATVATSAPYHIEDDPLSALTLDMQVLDRPAPPLPLAVHYDVLDGSFRLRHEATAWQFEASEVQLTDAASGLAANPELKARFEGHPRTRFALKASVRKLPAEAVWPLVLAFAPSRLDPFASLAPRGELRSLEAEVRRERAGAMPRFELRADVQGLAVEPHGRWPGLSGLTATIAGTDERGTISLRARQPSFTWPRYFRSPLQVDQVTADGGWHRSGQAWVLTASSFEAALGEARANGSLDFQFERRGISPVLRLDAEARDVDIAGVERFIPIGRLNSTTVAWLEGAFLGGRVPGAKIHYQGPVRRFPFKAGEGDFRVQAEVEAAALNYFPGFPPLTEGSGTVEFHNESIAAQVQSARAGGLAVSSAEFSLPDYKAPVIEVDGRGRGDLALALALLQGSPLGPRLGEQFMSLKAAGPADFRLQLHMATQDRDDRTYRVVTDLRSASVLLPALGTPAEQVTGRLEIRQDGASSESLRGRFLDGPFALSVSSSPPRGEATLAIDFRGEGRGSGVDLPQLLNLPAGIRSSGLFGWQLAGRLERHGMTGGRWPLHIEATSDLQGLVIEAPKPFAKQAEERRPTRVAVDIPRAGETSLDIHSGSGTARLEFRRSARGQWNMEQGIARFDGRPPGLPQRPGLQLLGDWPDVDLAEWFALGGDGRSTRRLQDWLGPADVHLDEVRVLGYEFRDVTARLSSGNAAWRVAVSGPMASGQLTIPHELQGPSPLVLDMDRLELVSPPAEQQGSAPEQETDPRQLPPMSVDVRDLEWQGRRFGHLQADLSRIPQGLQLDRFSSRAPDFSLDGSGNWVTAPEGYRSALELRFRSGNLAAAARALGYSDAVEAAEASASASLNWPGGPSERALAKMNGHLTMNLAKGQLRTIKPGAGRMLGLLSIYDLPRRLALDFRDVTDEGLAFNTVSGDFEIRSGSAYTENLLLRGPAVDIGVVGRTGLAAQDYDQTIVVSGNPSGALTVAGALAAGPVVGASVLLLSQLFKGQLQGLTRVYYHVTGPWSDPRVERITAQQSGTRDELESLRRATE